MSTFAAVMTGKGAGAISTIEVFGEGAEAVIKTIFRPAGGRASIPEPGKILLGTIVDGAETIDQVTIGCEGPNRFAIHCHGNPLIVELIMELLDRYGAKPITSEQLLAKTLQAQEPVSSIAVEAKIAQARAMTLEGTKLILNQIDGGLGKKAQEWLNGMEAISLEEVKNDARRILEDSRGMRLIVFGCTAVIIGPPNSGKSTLFNCLCGRQKAIVTDIRGTTRDWVSARCRIGSLSVELVDTAGLDKQLAAAPSDTVEKAAQRKTIEVLEGADLVLLNKCDISARLDFGRLPEGPADVAQVSAKSGAGIEKLVVKIPQVCGVSDFDLKSAVCVTGRQENLLNQLQAAESNC
ncbi:MAG: GTPase [Planctomycetota bacterium]